MDQSQLPELVRDTELRTRFDQHYTIHEFLDAPHSLVPPRQEVWKKVRAIGRGGFSYVFLEKCVQGQEEGSPHTRAVKVIPLTQGSDTRSYSRELEAVAKFSQRKFKTYFVKSFGWYSSAEELFISLEYFPLGDLQTYLNSTSRIFDDDAREITRQVLCGLNSMHNEGFAHRDLKPANILIKSCPPSPWWIKLGDFGLSKRTDATQMPSVAGGTSGFMAPDILETIYLGNCNTNGTPDIIPHERWIAADIWSLGEVVVRMLSGKATFRSHEHLMGYSRGTRSFPVSNLKDSGINSATIDFVQKAMTAKAADRITSQAGLAHHWVKVSTDPNTAFLPRSLPELESNANKTVSSTDYRGWTTSKLLTNTPPILMNSVSQVSNSQPKESFQTSIKRKPLPASPVVDYKSLSSTTNEASINVRSSPGTESNIHSDGTTSTEMLAFMNSADSQSSVALSSIPTGVQPGTRIDIAAYPPDEQHPLDYAVGEEGQVQLGLSPPETVDLKEIIISLRFSPDSQRLFIATATEFISRNQTTQPANEEQHNFPQGILCCPLTPDPRNVVLITIDGEIQLAELESKLTFRTILRLHHHPSCAAVSSDSERIAYVYNDKSIIILGHSPAKLFRKLKPLFGGHKEPVHWVNFDSNGDVISICRGGRLCIWVSAKGYDGTRLNVPLAKEPTHVAFAKSSRAIAVASGGTIKTWSRQPGQPLYRGNWYGISRRSPVVFMEFSSCGSRLYLGLRDGSCELWRIPGDEDPDLVVTLSGKVWLPSWTSNAIALSPDESRLALSTGTHLLTRDIGKALQVYNILNHFRHAVFADLSADGTKAASFCPVSVGQEVETHHYIVIIWDLQTASIMHVLQNKSNGVHIVAFSQDSRRLAVVSRDGVTTFWRVSTGKVISAVGEPIQTGCSLSCAAVSPDFRYVVTVERSLNQWRIWIWNTETGSTEHSLGSYELPDTEESKTAKGPPYSPPGTLTFLSNSRDFIGGNEYGILICDVLEGNIQNRSSSTSRASQRAPWDKESRERSTKWNADEYAYHWVDGLQVSPDSATVAYLSKGGKAYLYDLRTSDEPRVFESLTAPGRVAISPDWRLLVTTSWNKMVIWEISTNHIVKVLQDIRECRGNQPIEAVMFSPDSKHVFVLYKTCLLMSDIESLSDLAVVMDFSNYPGFPRSLIVSADLGRIILGSSWRMVNREEGRIPGEGAPLWRKSQDEIELWDYKAKVAIQVFSKHNLQYNISAI
ncbi:hypothetical protein FPSE_11167 [Fusarium pseudograminearum CS3096]|uniref:Protein kinase domain-containing protein n=1 Tax=Fusarium pseudograminearum (strain CS3096) TaxID=1028729 RepID=K3UB96_FUSPC|nr:hypothetical protein FPSE_11167 [Fusarium pseudograminearum CS3096]EKJ68656.1 hypothetical protein FPSE_11167 [Fusarium pseudograminearum CS3096]